MGLSGQEAGETDVARAVLHSDETVSSGASFRRVCEVMHHRSSSRPGLLPPLSAVCAVWAVHL